jgi:hypothetical protein
MKVYLMIAEHYSIPGIITRVCATRDKAIAEAMECVNIMLRDSGRKPVETETEMDAAIERLQDEHGAAYCYAEISEHAVV